MLSHSGLVSIDSVYTNTASHDGPPQLRDMGEYLVSWCGHVLRMLSHRLCGYLEISRPVEKTVLFGHLQP